MAWPAVSSPEACPRPAVSAVACIAASLRGSVGTKGQTPWATLNARLIVDVRDNPQTRFIRIGKPAKFSLKNVEASKAAVAGANALLMNTTVPEQDEAELSVVVPEKLIKLPYKERQLHPFLSRFAHYTLRGVYCKTIHHETSSKKKFAEWLHPDMVGFWFPFEDYNKELLALSGNGMSIARFFSFELKRELTFANLRESYFQAVSNSSWAHEGYLAAPNIDDSEDLRDELARLSGSFGIGVVELDLENPQASQVLFPSRSKEFIDWDGANKLAKENPDFRKFLTDVRIDISHAVAHASAFDSVPKLDELKDLWDSWTG